MRLYLPLLRPAIALGLALATCLPAAAQILIGQTAGFSGPVAAGVQETTDGAMVLHDPVTPQVPNVRATYQREAEKTMT